MSDIQTVLGEGAVQIEFDETFYPKDAIYGAAYVFIDRCYVFLDRAAPGRVRITLTPKKPQPPDELAAYLGEFANELLSCAWRNHLSNENRALLETVTVEAISSALGPRPGAGPTPDELANFDFSSQPFEDPLGIALSWEKQEKERQKAKSSAASSGSAAGAAAAPVKEGEPA